MHKMHALATAKKSKSPQFFLYTKLGLEYAIAALMR